MTLWQIMSYALIFSIPVLLVPPMLWLLRMIEQSTPQEQRAMLDYFAEKAVKYVEMMVKGASLQKKDTAINLIYSFYDTADKTAPAHALIEAAIEMVVWLINQNKLPDEFFDGDKRTVVNTGPIKPVLPPDPGGAPV